MSSGSAVYTPDAGFTGQDTFTVQASDGTLTSNVATVTVTVGSPPPASPVASIHAPSAVVAGTLVQVDALDSYDPMLGPLTYSWDLTGAGTFSGPDTAVAYITPQQPGQYTIGLRVTNVAGVSATTQRTISVVAPSAAASSQVITFTSTPPANPEYGRNYAVTATGGGSGNPVTFSIDPFSTLGACTLSGATVSFTGIGSCIIDANQAGNASYSAAAEAQQSFTIGKATVHVDANAAQKTYGEQDPAASATLRVSDFKNGDTAASSGIMGSASCSIASHSENAGTYSGAVTCGPGALAAAHYTFVAGNTAPLTINPATVHVDANAAQKTYGEQDPAASATVRVSDFKNGDTAASS